MIECFEMSDRILFGSKGNDVIYISFSYDNKYISIFFLVNNSLKEKFTYKKGYESIIYEIPPETQEIRINRA